MFGYSGAGYQGLQINPPAKTIEADLFKAFVAAGAISKNNSDDIKKSGFMRAARTDKGVHAAGNVVSLKLIMEDEDIVEKINLHLPNSIRVWGMKRTNKGFNCKKMCGSRVYEYLIPSYSFLPPRPESLLGKRISAVNGTTEVNPFWTNINSSMLQSGSLIHNLQDMSEEAKKIEVKAFESYRIPTDLLETVRNTLKVYEGDHNFHNFTIGKDFYDPSARRYMKSLIVSDPMIINNTEWLSIKIHGQSFMLHQIRKMVAMAALVIRTNCPTERIEQAFDKIKINIPKAPSFSLLLEHPVYEGYNERLVGKFGYDPIVFEPFTDQIELFKREYIYEKIYDEESKDQVFKGFFEYLDDLTQRRDQNGQDGEDSSIFDYLTNKGISLPIESQN